MLSSGVPPGGAAAWNRVGEDAVQRALIACCLLAGMLVAAVALFGAGPGVGPASDPPADSFEVVAFTTPFRELQVACETSGVLAKVHVEEGQKVAKDDLLAELKGGVQRAQLALSKARVEFAKLQIMACQATYTTRKTEYERVSRLFEQKISTAEERDKAKLDMELANLDLENAIAEKKIYELVAERDDEALKQTVIRAPRDGEVFRVFKRAGEAVEPRDPVLSLVCVDPLYVVAHLPISTAGRVKAGAKAAFLLESRAKVPLECTVTVVDKVADAASGTYRVKLTLPNPADEIMAGAKGALRLHLTSPDDTR